MMPGMTGWQFRAAQLEDPELAAVPVVLISGSSNTVDAMQRGSLRAAAALVKPISPDRLLAVVERYAGKPVSSASRRRSSAPT